MWMSVGWLTGGGRPKEHHVFDVLHWVKAAFKKHALDDVQESDCLNKEAFRCVTYLYLMSDQISWAP